MVHGISEILNEIHSWGWGKYRANSFVLLEDQFGNRVAGDLIPAVRTIHEISDYEFSVVDTLFRAEDVEEIRIRVGEKPLIILKKETPPTKSHRFFHLSTIKKDGLVPPLSHFGARPAA